MIPVDRMTVLELANYIEARVHGFLYDSQFDENSSEQQEMLLEFLAAVTELELRQQELVKGWGAL